MLISYNWLKSYIPEVPAAEKLEDVFNYHLCEMESFEMMPDGDVVFDIKVLPNRAHDLLSHLGVARELASLLNIKFVDPTPKYKIPHSTSSGQAELNIDVQTDKCRRYMGRIIRNVKVGPSPEWVVKHLESVGQRSINNIVDVANIVMFDCGQPTHAFDLDKTNDGIIVREAKDGEEMITLDNKEVKFNTTNMVIADSKNILAVAGIKGGKIAEVDKNTKNIIIEVANFDPISVRKTAQALNIFTDAKKRFENDLSPELGAYAIQEFSALIFEMCPNASFEDVVDEYKVKQEVKKLSFSADRVSKILGMAVSVEQIKSILERYNLEYKEHEGKFEIVVPPLRLDLEIEEDMAEEIGRVIGYDKLIGEVSKINFKPKINEMHSKILCARNKLLNDGYSEVMNTAFKSEGEVSVLASASDKKFLRKNLIDGLKDSLKLNQASSPLLGLNEVKVFEIGTVFSAKGGSASGGKNIQEEMHIAYANKKEIKEMTLDEYISQMEKNSCVVTNPADGTLVDKNSSPSSQFKMWSLFPFIARDIAVWVPEEIKSENVKEIIENNMGDIVVRGPELFDEFKKDGKISYAFRMVFQSFERTLTDVEINEVMTQITNKIKEKQGWQVR